MVPDGYIESTCCCVQARFLGLEIKIPVLFSLLCYIQHYLVFKALNLFLNKYVAKIQLPGYDIWLLSIPQKLYTEF
jgi:hypothetical protein